MRKLLIVLSLLGLLIGIPAFAQSGDACNIDAPAEPVTIEMISWPFAITEFYAAEMEACSDVDNLTINTNLLDSASLREQVALALSGGGDSPYDILHGANGQIADWGAPGWVMPLNDLIEKYWDEYDLGDIPQGYWDSASYNGNIYGVPVVGNTLHLVYRIDVFEENGWEVPDTYDDLLNWCDEVGLGNPDWELIYAMDVSRSRAWELEFFMLLRAMGGDYLDEDNMPAFNSDEGIAAVDLMIETVNRCVGADGVAYGLNEIQVAMGNGGLPLTKIWASRAATMADPERTDLGDAIGYAPAPSVVEGGPRAGSAWLDFYFIPTNTTNDPDLVFQVIMETADVASQQAAAAVGSTTRNSAAEYGGPYLPAANETIGNGIGNYAVNPAVSIAIAKLEQYLPLVWPGDMSAEEALEAAAADYITEATAQGYIEG